MMDSWMWNQCWDIWHGLRNLKKLRCYALFAICHFIKIYLLSIRKYDSINFLSSKLHYYDCVVEISDHFAREFYNNIWSPMANCVFYLGRSYHPDISYGLVTTRDNSKYNDLSTFEPHFMLRIACSWWPIGSVRMSRFGEHMTRWSSKTLSKRPWPSIWRLNVDRHSCSHNHSHSSWMNTSLNTLSTRISDHNDTALGHEKRERWYKTNNHTISRSVRRHKEITNDSSAHSPTRQS